MELACASYVGTIALPWSALEASMSHLAMRNFRSFLSKGMTKTLNFMKNRLEVVLRT